MNERQSFTMQRAQPVAGPGIDPNETPRRRRAAQHVIEGDGHNNGATRNDPLHETSTQTTATNTTTANPGNNPSIPLDDVLALLSVDRSHIESAVGAINYFRDLTPSEARTVLQVIWRLWPQYFGAKT